MRNDSDIKLVRLAVLLGRLYQLKAQPPPRTGPGGKPAYMIAPDAPRLWVDAVKVGELAGYPSEDGTGKRITEEMIDAFVRNLNESPDPIPVDGAQVSEVHGTPFDTATHAAGWAHQAEKRIADDGVPHMWLELELAPEVFEAIRAGRLKYGSIAFVDDGTDHETGEKIGPELDSYALTNKPFVKGLQPHMVLAKAKGERRVTFHAPTDTSPRISRVTYSISQSGERRLHLSDSKELNNMTQKQSDETTALATIQQVSKVLIEQLGIPEDTPPNEMGERALLKVAELKAKAGMAVDQQKPPADNGGDDGDGTQASDKGDGQKTSLAEDAEDAAAMAQISERLRTLSGQADATMAQLLEWLDANMEALQAAVGGGGDGADAGPGGQEPPGGEMSGELSKATARIVALEAKLKAVEEAADKAAKAKAKADAEAYVVKAFADRKLGLDDSAKETFVGVYLSSGAKAVDAALQGIKPVPPTGLATDPKGARPSGAANDSDAKQAAIEQCMAELRATKTNLSEKALRREAISLAAKRHKDLFN